MALPLSLVAYLALRRGGVASPVDRPPRPAGPVVWVHCPEETMKPVVAALSARLQEEAPRLSVVATAPEGGSLSDISVEKVPPELRPAARAFLAHWRPDALVWLGGQLRPVLLAEAMDRGVPAILADATAAGVGLSSGNWLPGVVGALLDGFDRALAVDAAAAQALRRAGMDETRIAVRGRLDPPEAVLPVSERERADLALVFGARPAWLAAEVPLSEMPAVIAAHKTASRRAHRLLLLLVPRDPAEAEALAEAARAEGLTAALRAQGEEPSDLTQVYVADGSGEMGLWYRLAPVTYFGGTLDGGGSRRPQEAAALGSAILHGPRTEAHAAAFDRLRQAGASRQVAGPMGLGAALETLLSPDRAATLAHAAWEVVSDGAQVLDELASLVIATVEDRA